MYQGWGWGSVAEHVPRTCKALGSILAPRGGEQMK